MVFWQCGVPTAAAGVAGASATEHWEEGQARSTLWRQSLTQSASGAAASSQRKSATHHRAGLQKRNASLAQQTPFPPSWSAIGRAPYTLHGEHSPTYPYLPLSRLKLLGRCPSKQVSRTSDRNGRSLSAIQFQGSTWRGACQKWLHLRCTSCKEALQHL